MYILNQTWNEDLPYKLVPFPDIFNNRDIDYFPIKQTSIRDCDYWFSSKPYANCHWYCRNYILMVVWDVYKQLSEI